MDKKDRFNEAFSYLKDKGMIHTQKDLAERMGSTSPNVSSALKGIESVLTDNFLKRFNSAFGSIFNEEWLISGNGEMLKPMQSVGDISNSNVSGVNVSGTNIHVNPDAYNTLLKIVEGYQKQSSKFQEEIDRLITILEKQLN